MLGNATGECENKKSIPVKRFWTIFEACTAKLPNQLGTLEMNSDIPHTKTQPTNKCKKMQRAK